jgi:septum formation protein
VDELTEGDPAEVAERNALLKVGAVEGETVLGVDTVVALDGRMYGKPEDDAEALATLRTLQGRAHEVIGGIAVRDAAGTRSEAVHTTVRFAPATEDELRRHVALGEWRGRAGGYAIQLTGAWLVEAVEGDYLNVVGLPVSALRRLLPHLR